MSNVHKRAIVLKNLKTLSILSFLLVAALTAIKAQENTETETYKPLDKIIWNGYFRSYLYYRNLPEKYGDTQSGKDWFKLNGGYNEPLVRLNAKTSPTPATNLEIEYTFDNLLTGQLTGLGASGELGRVSLPLQSIRFNSGISTKYGNFGLQAGGIRFYSITPLTFGGFLQEDDVFERVPWQGEDHPWTRYKKLYSKSEVAQASNSRFGSAIFQGYIFEGEGLPLGLSVKSMFGKSINSGGYQTWRNDNPIKMQLHRVAKKFSNLNLGLTFYNSFGKVSEDSREEESTRVLVSDYSMSFDGIALSGELGYGDYMNPILERSGSEIIKANLNIGESVAWLNIDLQVYRLGASFVNQNSEMINTSVSSASNKFGDTSNLGAGYLPGVVTLFGQMANNRQGVNVKLSKDIGDFKASLGIASAQEITNISNAFSFQHRLNKDARSRFSPFQTGIGPYNRLTSIYLTTYETVGINDPNNSLKSFNTLDLKLKYATRIGEKEVIFLSTSNYNTVGNEIAALPLGENLYLKHLYVQVQSFIKVHQNVVLALMTGTERSKGGTNTDLATNGKPIDQTGMAYGVGFDVQMANRSSLHIRQRWYSHKDANFVDDKFRGADSSVELKIFF